MAFGYLVRAGVIPVTVTQIATVLGYSVLAIVALYFIYIWTLGGHTVDENKRMGVIFWLFLLIAVFWSGFEQAGTSLNIFARDLTDRDVLGWEMPAAFLQSVNATFIIILKVRGRRVVDAGWTYPEPTAAFDAIRGRWAFYAQKVDECWIDDERVSSNEGSFYGGWVTENVTGPFKGAPGTMHW